MGGQSYECKICGKWFLSRKSLFDHIKDSHEIEMSQLVSGVHISPWIDAGKGGR